MGMKGSLVSGGRCPKCTLKPPCKHYETLDDLPGLAEVAPAVSKVLPPTHKTPKKSATEAGQASSNKKAPKSIDLPPLTNIQATGSQVATGSTKAGAPHVIKESDTRVTTTTSSSHGGQTSFNKQFMHDSQSNTQKAAEALSLHNPQIMGGQSQIDQEVAILQKEQQRIL
jgi:hypothetical protein